MYRLDIIFNDDTPISVINEVISQVFGDKQMLLQREGTYHIYVETEDYDTMVPIFAMFVVVSDEHPYIEDAIWHETCEHPSGITLTLFVMKEYHLRGASIRAIE